MDQPEARSIGLLLGFKIAAICQTSQSGRHSDFGVPPRLRAFAGSHEVTNQCVSAAMRTAVESEQIPCATPHGPETDLVEYQVLSPDLRGRGY